MTVLDRVADLVVKSSPGFLCDDCIADRLTLSVRQHANHKTRELAQDRRFDRRRGQCSVCKRDKLVIGLR